MAFDLVKKLCVYDPLRRYFASEALNHPFIQQLDSLSKVPLTFQENLEMILREEKFYDVF